MNRLRFYSSKSVVVVLICCVSLLSGCKSKRPVAERESTPKNALEIIEQATAAQLKYTSFSAKVSADIKVKKQSNSFKATLRMRADSAIWMSISPALGIEVFRLLCTVDSVKYVDKINNRYFLGDYKMLNKLTNSELSLEVMEQILTGNLLYFNPESKYRSNTDKSGYYLATRNTNRLRRIVGADRREALDVIPDSLSAEQINEKKLHRIQDKLEDEDLIVRQYWFDFDSMKIIQSTFTDLVNEVSLKVSYNEHELVETALVPTKISIDLGNANENAMFRLSYSKIKLNGPVEMPFSIPEKYEQVFP
jgi:hypothetical protein